jgi:hypothetical protein
MKLGFKASLVDSCVSYHGKTTFMLYVDDGIFTGPDKEEIVTLIRRCKVSSTSPTRETSRSTWVCWSKTGCWDDEAATAPANQADPGRLVV